MKTLTANTLAEIAKRLGTEPLNIIEIEWAVGSTSQYADREVLGFQGKILELSTIQTSVTLDAVTTQQVQVTLDDTDGSIKAILDTIDVHKKHVRVYQFFGGLTETDKFAVFTGQIATPITWAENDRQIVFTLLSEVESYEVGFSPEEGQLDFVNPKLIGKPWPLCFGNVVHVPATKVTQREEAQLLETVGIIDPTLYWKLTSLERSYQIEAFMLQFWILVMRGANAIAPDVRWILDKYILAIIQEDYAVAIVQKLLLDLNAARKKLHENPDKPEHTLFVVVIEEDLQIAAQAAHILAEQKEEYERLAELARFEYAMKKRAANEQIAAYNSMRAIIAEYQATWKEICTQAQFNKECVKVQNSEIFEQEVDVDVVIKGVQWRVQFDNNVMCFIAGPISRNQRLIVAPWQQDDEPCSGLDGLDGLDLFWLDDTNGAPPNLEGQWLLVKKRGSDDSVNQPPIRHIIKVERQVGTKVYFTLVKWNSADQTGQPRGDSLDRLIGRIVETPFLPGPFGNPVPADVYSGNLDPEVWYRPESKMLLDILAITGPVSEEELRTLTALVFLLPNDELGDSVYTVAPSWRETFTIIGEDVETILGSSGLIQKDWLETWQIPYEEIPDSLAWSAESGSAITKEGPDCEIYIANILPSTIMSVFAYRTNTENQRFLAPVPSRYYIKNESANLGTIDVTALTFPTALANIGGQNWEDEVYVTLNSSIGPNVVDIIEHLITTYLTNKTPNAANFAAIKAKLQTGGELYPAHFALLTRPDALQEIQDIAWEARLAVFVVGSEVFLKYLSEEPSSVDTITESEIAEETLSISYTDTEDLVTVLDCTFKEHYLPLEDDAKDPRIVLRHNVKKYGVHKMEKFFHIYAHRELVLKSMTYHLIRRANTWKRLSFSTFQSQLPLDLFDTVLLSLQNPHVANSDIKAIVESAIYDTSIGRIDFVVNTGVRVGEMEQYIHFWPALQSATTEFPTNLEIQQGLAGGYGPGAGVIGTIDDCPGE